MRPTEISQDCIRGCFGVGQTVLVRTGKDWVSREILGITVLRNNVACSQCGMPILGEPRFWFKDYGNIPLEEIMAKEDIITPKKSELPARPVGPVIGRE